MSTNRSEKEADWKSNLMDRFRDPHQARLIMTGTVLVLAYFGVYWPLGSQVSTAASELTAERRRLELVREMVALQADLRLAQKHLPPPPKAPPAPKGKTKTTPPVDDSSDEWARTLLANLQSSPAKLLAFDAEKPRSVGPYKVTVLKITLEGQFADLNAFLRLLDSNERLTRTDRVVFEVLPNGSAATLQVTVLGITNR